MSHQTGIKSNEGLRQMMLNAKRLDSQIRLFAVKINQKSEQLELANDNDRYLAKGNWEEDFQRYVRKTVTPEEPCYLFFRMDTKNNEGFHDWTFILYSPEQSNVRKKMLYASTKSTLKNDFGTGILYDYFADSFDMLGLSHFQSWMFEKNQTKMAKNNNSATMGGDEDDYDVEDDRQFSAANQSGHSLLTANEDERRKVKEMEYELSLSRNEKKSSNFQFPIRPDAINALLDFRDNHIIYLKLKVNLSAEEIQLDTKATAAQHPVLATVLSMDNQEHREKRLLPEPGTGIDDGNIGFHIFSSTHLDPDGAQTKKTLFVFVMPTEKTTVKQRIAYSACLNSLFDSITNRISIVIDKRLEVDDSDDITFSYVATKLYPVFDQTLAAGHHHHQQQSTGGHQSTIGADAASQLKFNKPRPPPGRGPRRIIK